jgi:hypothetical protein
VAAARSKDRGKFSGRDAERAGGQHAAGEKPPGRRGAAAQAAKTIAGIWKEFNEEDGELPSEWGGTTSGGEDGVVAVTGRRTGEEDEAGEGMPAQPVARIVAYSDSDSDEPLPFQVQQAQRKHAKRTLDPAAREPGAGEESGGSAPAPGGSARRHWWAWRGRRGSRDGGSAAVEPAGQACPPVSAPRRSPRISSACLSNYVAACTCLLEHCRSAGRTGTRMSATFMAAGGRQASQGAAGHLRRKAAGRAAGAGAARRQHLGPAAEGTPDLET